MRAILASLAFVLIPCLAGNGLARLWHNDSEERPFGRPATAFAFGIFLWSWLAWAGYLVHSTVYAVALIYLVITLATYGLLLARRSHPGANARATIDPLELGTLLAVLLLAVAYMVVGADQDPSGDEFVHLAYIRKIYERGTLTKADFILSTTDPSINHTYGYNAVYALYGFIARLFHVDPTRLWLYAAAALIPILFSAYYRLSDQVFHQRAIPLLTLALLVGSWVAAPPPAFDLILRSLGQPSSIGLLCYAALVAELLRATDGRPWRLADGLILGLSAASLLAVHPEWWAFSLITAGWVLIYNTVRRHRAASWTSAATVGATCLFSVPMLGTRSRFRLPVAHAIARFDLARYSPFIYHVGRLFAFNPFGFLSPQEWGIVVIALTLLVLSAANSRRRLAAPTALCVLVVLGTAMLPLNPLTAPVLVRLGNAEAGSRIFSIVNIWGLLLLTDVLMASWGRWALLWRRWPLVRWGATVAMSAIAGWSLAGAAIVKLAVGIHKPEVREELLRLLRQIPQDLQAHLVGWVGLAVGVSISALAIAVAGRLAGRDREAPRRRWIPRPGYRVWAPPLAMAILLLAPGSNISLWWGWLEDHFLSEWYGPTLTEFASSQELQRMLAAIEPGSTVLTDNERFVLPFRDVRIVSDLEKQTATGIRINAFLAPVFADNAPIRDVLSRLSAFSPDYLILSPRSSQLAWTRYDRFPAIFQKVFNERIPGLQYYNSRFVVYRLHLGASATAVARVAGGVRVSHGCGTSRRRISGAFQTDMPAWSGQGQGSLLGALPWRWQLLRDTSFFVEDRFDSDLLVDRVSLRIQGRSGLLQDADLYASDDGHAFYACGSLSPVERLRSDEQDWGLNGIRRRARYLRLALHGSGSITIVGMTVYGCDMARQPIHAPPGPLRHSGRRQATDSMNSSLPF